MEGTFRPCSIVLHRADLSNTGLNHCFNCNQSTLWALYNNPYVGIEKEYVLMDLAAIISAIGGALGLFLGFSCFGVAWDAFEWLEKMFLHSKNVINVGKLSL